MSKNTSVTLGNHFEDFVQNRISAGRYKNASEVIVKARGKFIARAVDVAEVASKRFLDGQAVIDDVKIDSEEFENKEGKQVRVSTIEILLKRKK